MLRLSQEKKIIRKLSLTNYGRMTGHFIRQKMTREQKERGFLKQIIALWKKTFKGTKSQEYYTKIRQHKKQRLAQSRASSSLMKEVKTTAATQKG